MEIDDKKELEGYTLNNEYFITREEYLQRISILQQATFETLIQRDEQFGGDDGVEGILVFGSYAKSHPLIHDRIYVHRQSSSKFVSDIDIYTIMTSKAAEIEAALEKELSFVDRVLQRRKDHTTVEDVQNVFLLYPGKGFGYALKDTLKGMGVSVIVESAGSIEIDDPNETVPQELARGLKKGTLIKGGGLLFLPESVHKSRILDIFRGSKIPIILNPATEALRIS